MSDFETWRVPLGVFPELSSRRVLTMSLLDGYPLDSHATSGRGQVLGVKFHPGCFRPFHPRRLSALTGTCGVVSASTMSISWSVATRNDSGIAMHSHPVTGFG